MFTAIRIVAPCFCCLSRVYYDQLKSRQGQKRDTLQEYRLLRRITTDAKQGNDMSANKLVGFILVILSSIFFLMGAAAIVNTARVLAVHSTLAAIESAFGTLVLTIGLLALAWICLKTGIGRLTNGRANATNQDS
jgi:protein-S-isoprenylcysteine O-methyltransferase Ste14